MFFSDLLVRSTQSIIFLYHCLKGPRQNASTTPFQALSFGQPSWPFGGDIIPCVNPFDGESASKVSWMMPDSDFQPQGTQNGH